MVFPAPEDLPREYYSPQPVHICWGVGEEGPDFLEFQRRLREVEERGEEEGRRKRKGNQRRELFRWKGRK